MQGSNQQSTDIAVIFAAILLLFFSAWDKTAKPAIVIGLLLLLLSWSSAFQNGTLKTVADNLF